MILVESSLFENSGNQVFSPFFCPLDRVIAFSIREVGKLHGALSYLRRALQMEVGSVYGAPERIVTSWDAGSQNFASRPCQVDGLRMFTLQMG